jgi:hypothetical protein
MTDTSKGFGACPVREICVCLSALGILYEMWYFLSRGERG